MKAPLLKKIKEADLTKVFIGLGAGVDPDGLASQLAMETIIKAIKPEAEVHCFYRGEFDRTQNRTMRELMSLNPRPYSEFKVEEYTCLIMVDGPASVMPNGIQPHFIIDHHEKDGEPAVAEDVRMIGSCSAIMWEYVMEVDPELLEGEKGSRLAAALAIGVCTDTEERTVPKTDKLDFEAEGYCGPRANKKMYNGTKNYPKPPYQKDMEMQAWAIKKVKGQALTTTLGVIPKERKGAVSSIAQEFCGQGRIDTTISTAKVGNGMAFAVRSLNPSINVNNMIKEVYGFGGGKPGAGAGRIPFPDVCKDIPKELEQKLSDVFHEIISYKTFKYVGDGIIEKGEENT